MTMPGKCRAWPKFCLVAGLAHMLCSAENAVQTAILRRVPFGTRATHERDSRSRTLLPHGPKQDQTCSQRPPETAHDRRARTCPLRSTGQRRDETTPRVKGFLEICRNMGKLCFKNPDFEQMALVSCVWGAPGSRFCALVCSSWASRAHPEAQA